MSDKIKDACQAFRMLVIAHRLRKFGFESQINDLKDEELILLSTMLYPHQRLAIEREVALRQEAALITEDKGVSHG